MRTGGCDGETQAREIAGPDAIDCGVVRLGRDPSVVDACVLDAFRRGQPFHARYEQLGIDSHVARFLALGDGTYWELDWGSYGDCPECPYVIAYPCDSPVEEAVLPPPDGGAPDRPGPLVCATEPARETLCRVTR